MNNPENVTREAFENADWGRHLEDGVLCYYLQTRDGSMLAYIAQRNRYCDRGHWLAHVEVPCGLDVQDGFPRYFMRLGTAKTEVSAFLRWRLFGVRAEDTPPTLLDAFLLLHEPHAPPPSPTEEAV